MSKDKPVSLDGARCLGSCLPILRPLSLETEGRLVFVYFLWTRWSKLQELQDPHAERGRWCATL